MPHTKITDIYGHSIILDDTLQDWTDYVDGETADVEHSLSPFEE